MSWMPLLGFVPWLMERLAKTSKLNGLAQNHSHDFIELFNDRISDPVVAIDPIFALSDRVPFGVPILPALNLESMLP